MAMLMPMSKPTLGRQIGETLKALAVRKGLSQGQVAANAHLSQPTVSALFNGGTQDPPIGTVLKLAQVLGCSLDELVGLKPLDLPDDLPAPPVRAEDFAELAKQVANLASAMHTIQQERGKPPQSARARKRPA